MTAHRRLSLTLTWSLLATACATTSPLLRQQCDDADAQLTKVLQPLEALRAKGCHGGVVERGGSECDRLRLELERLVLVCPGHAPTLMANAVVAYDESQPIKAQQYLDEILAQPRRYPDAAVLRSRIAIEEGNLPFARRLLEQHLRLVPDHAGLHETYGAALYLDGQLDQAVRELTSAAGLGAPAWRIAYHLGLVDEAAGRFDAAEKHYAEALAGNPGWAPAQSRANALRARSGVRP